MIMPDSRIRLRHEGPSLLNVPTPVFQGPAHSLYGPRGPQRAAADYAARKPLSGQPETLEHCIDDALALVDLTGRQKNALRAELMRMTRSLDFIKLVHDQAHQLGLHSDQAAGVPMDQGRPL
jgi:hypothetical protein